MPFVSVDPRSMWRTKKLQACVTPGKATPSSPSGIADERLRLASEIADERLRLAAGNFYQFRKKLKQLDTLLRAHLKDLKRSAESRALVLQALGNVSRDSPMYELVGGGDAKAAKEVPSLWAQASSYSAAVQAREASVELDRYESEIVAYVEEWEKTVSTRVATELKHIQALHKTWEKYHHKVESLKSSAQKKKQTSSTLEDKISWNESKLRTARKEYRRNLIAVTLLTEEITDRGWKDVVPLMIRMIDFDIHGMKNAGDLVSGLSHVREEMIELSRRYEMDFEALHTGRLRILREEDAIDFVEPGDLQDLESTIAGSIAPRGAAGMYSRAGKEPTMANPYTPPCSDMDSQSQAAGEKDDLAPPHSDRINVKEETEAENEKDTFEDTNTVLNYPSSIYLVGNEGGPSRMDDETTLTGAPDLVSV